MRKNFDTSKSGVYALGKVYHCDHEKVYHHGVKN